MSKITRSICHKYRVYYFNPISSKLQQNTVAKANKSFFLYYHLITYWKIDISTKVIILIRLIRVRSSHQRCSMEKVLLEISQNSQENTCARVSFLIKLQALACNFIKKETLAQVFSCKFCKISKNIFFTEHLWTTASDELCYNFYYCKV